MTRRSRATARHARINFPLLSDTQPKGALSRLYSVYREREELSARAIFVIDREGGIRFSEAYPDALNPGVNDILTTLEELADLEDTADQEEDIRESRTS